jgi:hypothetical protein
LSNALVTVENGGTNRAKAIDDHDIAVKIIGPVSEPLGHNHHAAVRIQSNDARGCGCVNVSGALVIGYEIALALKAAVNPRSDALANSSFWF